MYKRQSQRLPEPPRGSGKPKRGSGKDQKTLKMARNRLRTLRLSCKHAHPDRTGAPVPLEPIIPQNPSKKQKNEGFGPRPPRGPGDCAEGACYARCPFMVFPCCSKAPEVKTVRVDSGPAIDDGTSYSINAVQQGSMRSRQETKTSITCALGAFLAA